MSETPFASRRFPRGKRCRAKKQSHRVRPQVERLEDRVVPSYFPDTTNGIHIFEDQLPSGMSNAMVQFLAAHTDGTQKELLSQTNQFRAINPNFTVLHYQLGTSNSPFDYIINDQWASDWNYVNQQESWFAHQTYSGEPQSAGDLASGRVGNSTGLDLADIADPAWQQYTLNQVFQNMAATGSNGWFADSYTFGIGGGGLDGNIPTRYQGTNAANPADWPGGVTWTTQLGDWAQAIENAFAQHNATYGTDYKFIPNLDARVTSWEPNWYDNANGVPFIDGGFLEGFGEYTDTYDWTLSMNRGLNLTDNGKIVIMQPYPSADPTTAAGQQQVNFFLGTYLLLKGDQTYLNIDYGGGAQYFPQYGLNLGAPTTPLPSNVSSYLWNGVYRRDFQNGIVLVNPGSATYTLNLGGTYQEVEGSGGGTLTDSQIDANGNYIGGSLNYQNVSSVTLTGGSAVILMNESSQPPDTVFSLRTDDSLWQRTASGWQQLTPAGAVVSISAITDASGNDDVYAVAANRNLWEHTPSGWAMLSAGSFQQLSAATNASGAAVVFAVLTDDSLWENSSLFPGDHWRMLSPAGTVLSVSAVTDASGNDDVYAVVVNHNLWEHTPSGWLFLSPGSFQSLSAGRNGSGQAVVYAVLTDHSLWEDNPAFSGGWRNLSPAGTILSATAAAPDEVFAITADNHLWQYKLSSGWSPTSTGSFASISGENNGGQGELFAVLTDDSLWEYSPSGWAMLDAAVLAVSAPRRG
ncbi:MAG TPA: putative glycoside hydrolase [Gemmataceae bacterium]|nr:putative glycoside hydrolase [Gemmataceae bacterium]